jgi:hypothetical protein
MSRVKFTMTPGWEKTLTDQIRNSPIQKAYNQKAQSILREVGESMQGQDAETVMAALLERFSGTNITPNVPNLRKQAELISAGGSK